MTTKWMLPLLLTTGCVATDVGNPQDEPTESTQVEVEFEAYEEQVANALLLDDGVELTDVWVVTDNIRMRDCEVESPEETPDVEGEETEETEDTHDYEGITATNLLTGSSFPESPFFDLTMSDFCGFEFDPTVADVLPDGAPSDLDGLSMLVRGKRKDGTAFEVRGTFEDTVELDGEVHLDPGRINRLVVGFAVNGWVEQRDLGALTEEPILIGESNNEELYEQFTTRFNSSIRLFIESTSRGPIAQ